MVDKSTLTKLRQFVIFSVLLAAAAIAVAVLARIRGGLIVFRAGFAVFNVLSFFYCLSLVGQKAWETSARIANAFRHPAKESSNVECN
jgi:hypothetical protein